MNKKEKEQWLYEAYKYTSNFDFSRLDKYEEANDDICISDLILDYTMLYEFHKEEIERLNKFLRAFSDFIDDEEYWKSLGVNGEDIECKVSHKWNELLYKIVHKGSDK